MKKLFTYLCLITTCKFSTAQVVPNVDWVRNYSDRNSIENVPSAIDASNNVVITGYTFVAGTEDFTTLKYDASGTLLWVVHYNNGGSDRANAIAIDNSDNIYVLGQSVGVGTSNDYALVKYNSSGVQQWVKRYNGTANGDDIPLALTIDNTGAGAVYVTGKSETTGAHKDYTTLKYSTTGIQIWAHHYNGTGNSDDEAVALALGTGNRLYVTGTAFSSTAGNDIVTIRLNTNTGAMNWSNTMNGSANTTDQGFSMVLDGNDPVIAGKIRNTGTNDDYSIHKINGNTGVTNWSKTYDGFGGNDLASSIVRDPSGNFLVTGVAPTASNITEYHTLKLNNAGVQQWVNKESTGLLGYNVVPKITVDFLSHMYILGQVQNAGGNSDVFIYQVTPTGGNTTWKETHNGAANGTDAGVDFLVNNIGQLYLAAQTKNSFAKWDYTTIKISQTPVVFPPDFDGEAPANSLAFYENKGQLIKTNGSLTPENRFYTNSSSPRHYFQNTSMSYVFTRLDTDSTTDDTLHRIDLTFEGSNQFTKIYNFEVLDPYLNYYLGHCPLGVPNVKGSQRLMVPNIYPNIDLHYYSNQNGLKYYFVVKPGGDPTLIKLLYDGATGSSINTMTGELTINSSIGNIVQDKPTAYQINPGLVILPVAGADYVNAGVNKYKFSIGAYNPMFPLIIQIDQGSAFPPPPPIGNLEHATYYGGTGIDSFQDSVTDGSGNQYIAGLSWSTNFPTVAGYQLLNAGNASSDAIVLKINSSSVTQWATYYGGGTPSVAETNDEAYGIDVDNLGNVFFTGFSQSTNFPCFNPGGGAYFDNVNNTGFGYAQDIFIVKLTNAGIPVWATLYGKFEVDEWAYDLAIDGLNNVYVVGDGNASTPTLFLPGATYDTLGSAIIIKFDNAGVRKWATRFGGFPGSYIRSCAVDNLNQLLITGYLTAPGFPGAMGPAGAYITGTKLGSSDAFIAKYDVNNLVYWQTLFGGDDSDAGTGIATDNFNNIYFTGYTTSQTSFPVDDNGGIGYYEGLYQGPFVSAGDGDVFLTKFDPNGDIITSTFYGGSSDERGTDIAIDNTNRVFVTGYTYSSTFPQQSPNPSGTFSVTTIGTKSDAFMLSFDGNLNRLWTTYFGGSGSGAGLVGTDYGYGVATYQNSKLYLVGATASHTLLPIPLVDLGGGAHYDPSMSGTFNGFYARFDLSSVIGINEALDSSSDDFLVYPNPTNGNLTIEFNNKVKSDVQITFTNVEGQTIFSKPVSQVYGNQKMSLDISAFAKGIYFVQIKTGDSSMNKKIILD